MILIGKPTDNSGFGGASFASLELEEEKKEQNKGAVQEPNAFGSCTAPLFCSFFSSSSSNDAKLAPPKPLLSVGLPIRIKS